MLADLGNPRRACIVIEDYDVNIYKSFRNFPGVNIRTADDLCALDVIGGGLIVAQQSALDKVATRVGQSATSRNHSNDAGGK
jgi:ribosomal protein L4